MYFDGPKAFGLLCFSKEAEKFISHGSGSLKAKITVHGDSVSCERIFLLCFHMAEKDGCHPQVRTSAFIHSFTLNYLLKTLHPNSVTLEMNTST